MHTNWKVSTYALTTTLLITRPSLHRYHLDKWSEEPYFLFYINLLTFQILLLLPTYSFFSPS